MDGKEIGDELYALAPKAFTAARDEHAARARTEGDRALAATIMAFKRPTVAAWLVNLVALARPDSIERLIDLGDEIRVAQGAANVTPAQIRDLSTKRRQELDTILREARSLVVERGEPAPGPQHLAEAEATFAAAMADEDSARLVRAGRVLKALSYSGFGQSPPTGFPEPSTARPPQSENTPPETAPRETVLSETAPRETAKRKTNEKDAVEREAVEREAAEREAAQREAAEREAAELAAVRREAAQRVAQAQAALAEATDAERTTEAAVKELTDQLSRLRDQLDASQQRARASRQKRLAAERDVASAKRRQARTANLPPGGGAAFP